MALGENKYSMSSKDKVNIDPDAQLAFEKLVGAEHRRKIRQKIFRLLVVLIFILVATPWVFNFYCSNIVGTNYETIVLLKYPSFTEKMVRAAVITDKWLMNLFWPVLKNVNSNEENGYRRAVIELGMETTGNRESDPEKVSNLRAVVAASLLKSPGGIAFAVYELPPKKVQ